MRQFLVILRSVLFQLTFFGGTIPLLMTAFAALPLNRRAFLSIARGWSRYHRWCARWIVGQRVVVEGVLPREPAFFVLKHESMFETMDLPHMFGTPMIAAKKELLQIPLWGILARAYGLLGVDRDAGAAALRQLRTDARAALDEGRALCLFPEGTRVAHGDSPPLKSGFAGLYALLKLPVIPVAVFSGPLNPRGFLRYPGVIRYHIGAPVPPGLKRAEAEARVHAAINLLNDLPSRG